MNALNFFDVQQNTEEWLLMRCGLLTSSSISKVMANYGGAFGDPAKRLAIGIALERITGQPIGSGFSNAHTDRGHEQEPVARMLYEEETFCSVSNGGFFCNDIVGCSPDGLVGDCGAIEIKSVIASTHYATVARGSYDPAYKWQVIANLMFTGRQWIDFVSYCEGYPIGKRLFIYRLAAPTLSKEFGMIRARIAEFMPLVDAAEKSIQESRYSILETQQVQA
ncbi:MAG: YqaJ viral recombinase family protein [Gammaproteobacteria bacterium]|nr:YqaJ viral recombinase family protein [Gammaproteobacteria bacterium]MCP5013870.1 YqaJ viral recombinase family protein [Ketobacter sp.]